MRIVQFRGDDGKMNVATVIGEKLRVIEGFSSTYELASAALQRGIPINTLIDAHVGDDTRLYSEVLASGRIDLPVNHPDPARLWVTGTGLTHLGSASARDSMHSESETEAGQTDTMRMFQMGLREGKPPPGAAGVQPEWFYKGNGTSVVAPGAPIYSPSFSLLDGDEIEICVFYIIAEDGTPYRLGYALGNEFSDHRMEKINYLYLAHSKLRPCSYGPELLLGELPASVRGKSRILRDGIVIWEEEFLSGEDNMSHSLANLEHHHFKYDLFRRPGDLHCHYLGTATASFSKNIEPKAGDVFEMEADGFGAALRNTLTSTPPSTIVIKKLFS